VWLFGDVGGDIYVYDDDGATVIETIQIDARTSMSEEGRFFCASELQSWPDRRRTPTV